MNFHTLLIWETRKWNTYTHNLGLAFVDAPIMEIYPPDFFSFINGKVKNRFSKVACVLQWSGDIRIIS